MAERVGDVPRIKTSRGSTKISLEGATVFNDSAPAPRRKDKDTHEAASSFGVVYVNDLARAAMSAGPPSKFPAGSIIVREKLSKPDDARPELLAVMVKRAPGFNPKANDWEFLTVDGALTKVRQRQKNGSCVACHTSQRENDFVFPLPAGPGARP